MDKESQEYQTEVSTKVEKIGVKGMTRSFQTNVSLVKRDGRVYLCG